MGTTCTALALQNGSAISAHVGDSRLYLVRNGKITLQTEDHSVVREMVKTGLISDEEARRHPDKNLILRAMGRHPDIEVAMWREPLAVREGDQFLLCSDGLSDLVSDEEMKEAVLLKPLHAACESLVALAKERGGHDNVTVGIVSVRLAGASENVDAPETREVKTAP
jgi:protein phosphatase